MIGRSDSEGRDDSLRESRLESGDWTGDRESSRGVEGGAVESVHLQLQGKGRGGRSVCCCHKRIEEWRDKEKAKELVE